ncbi:hypothetical protein HID58_094370, partial [Brassica napus]
MRALSRTLPRADAHWVASRNVEEPPPEPWVPVRPFSERVVGRPSRLDQASVSVECISSFRLLWGCTTHSSFSGRSVRRPKPSPWWLAFWGYFSPERVSAAVDTHRSCFSSSIDDDMGLFFEDTSLPAVYATGQSSGRRPPDADDDAENRPSRIPSL